MKKNPLDIVGGGNPILKREFWELPFGSSIHDVQTRMDRLGELDFLESENFLGMFVAKYNNVDIDSTYSDEYSKLMPINHLNLENNLYLCTVKSNKNQRLT